MIFHRHIWQEQDRQFGYIMRSGDFTLDVPAKKYLNAYVTLVSCRCDRCGRWKQIRLDGHVRTKGAIPEVFLKGVKD